MVKVIKLKFREVNFSRSYSSGMTYQDRLRTGVLLIESLER